MILLELLDSEIIQRLLARGREDDNESVIRHRLDVYREKTEPLIDYYRNHSMLLPVEANGSIQEISARIEAILI